MPTTQEKYERLKEYLRGLGSVAVAFSSGVDSTFLLKTAHDELGEKVIAVTATSHTLPQRELQEATAFCKGENIKQVVCVSEELDIPEFRRNPTNRCYLCKRGLFSKIKEIAAKNGIAYVAEGSNMDDEGDYRPGLKAIAELGIKSPLRKVGLYKEEIRGLSKEIGLTTWDKASQACLASRFAYGERISEERLKMVERAEEVMLDKGFKQVRVRVHGKVARIEVLVEELEKVMEREIREEVIKEVKECGFEYVTLDLEGYRSGSMNLGLKK